MATALTIDFSTAGRRTVARYERYEAAQLAVDHLSDAGFPVNQVEIVGSDLHLVERVTGRLTSGKAALAGAGSGAWFGLFVGLLVGLFTTGPTWLGLVLGGAAIGAAWGALFGYFAHMATGGQRDFSSTQGVAAEHYDVTVSEADEERARTLIAQMTSVPAAAAAPQQRAPDRDGVAHQQ
jgi:hypothetical protein